jgi:hypothetical protein
MLEALLLKLTRIDAAARDQPASRPQLHETRGVTCE